MLDLLFGITLMLLKHGRGVSPRRVHRNLVFLRPRVLRALFGSHPVQRQCVSAGRGQDAHAQGRERRAGAHVTGGLPEYR